MISFVDAIGLIRAYALSPDCINLNTSSALGYHLAKDIFAPIDLPPFDNSAVDGFAVCTEHVRANQAIALAQTLRAVGQASYSLSSESCAKKACM